MEFIAQIIIGLIMIAVGILTLKYNYQTANNLPLRFIEEKLGSGSSYTIWKVLSFLLIIAGLMTIFGFWRPILEWILSPLTNMLGGSNQQY